MGPFNVQDVIDGIKAGTQSAPKLQRQPVYMKDVYVSLITRHYEEMGLPRPEFIDEIPDLPRAPPPSPPDPEPILPSLDTVTVRLDYDEEQGTVKCHVSGALCDLHEAFYTKAVQPPIDEVVNAYRDLGFSEKYLETLLKKHHARLALIEKADLNKIFKVDSGPKTSRRTTKKSVKEVVTVEEEEASDDEEDEDDDDHDDDGAFDMELDEDEEVADDATDEDGYMSDL